MTHLIKINSSAQVFRWF